MLRDFAFEYLRVYNKSPREVGAWTNMIRDAVTACQANCVTAMRLKDGERSANEAIAAWAPATSAA